MRYKALVEIKEKLIISNKMKYKHLYDLMRLLDDKGCVSLYTCDSHLLGLFFILAADGTAARLDSLGIELQAGNRLPY